MRQRVKCAAASQSQTVSIAVAEQQAANVQQDRNEFGLEYADGLEQDLPLFDLQLEDELNTEQDMLLENDFDLLELINTNEQPQQRCQGRLTSSRVKRDKGRKRRTQATHSCDVCGRTFSEPYNLRIHKMTHTNEKPHICDTCGKGFRQLNKLRVHYVTHTKARPYACDICGKSYRFANYLAIHRRLHTGEKPYACELCDMAFHSIHARRLHLKLKHAQVNGAVGTDGASTAGLSYTCPICSRVLTDQCYLNTHLKRHYNQRDFVCQQCEKRFVSASELKHHQIGHNQLERPYSCSQCGARFLRKSNYKQHLKIHAR